MPYWLGDSPRAVLVASRRPVGRDGGRYTDTNVQAARDGEVCMHWGIARNGGWKYIVVSTDAKGVEKRRPMTTAELTKQAALWKVKDIKRWRLTLHGEVGNYKSNLRIYDTNEMIAFAKKHGVVPCFELKSELFAKQPQRAVRMRQQAIAHGARVYVMALVTMPRWAGKMKAFHNAGWETALLPHGARKPLRYAYYKKYITRVWGNWA